MFRRSGSRKIFCIGFNKTGTTSLHSFFCAHHLASLHSVHWPHWSYDRSLKRKFRKWTCYSDGQLSNFRTLDAWFPDSAFILNRRDVRPWLRSRIKHVLRLGYSEDLKRGLLPPGLGRMATEFFTEPRTAIDKWLLERVIYHRSARLHFNGRPVFLEVDVTTDGNWAGTLTAFLQDSGFRLADRHDLSAIHANRREDSAVIDQERAERFFALADERIAALGAEMPID